MGLFRWFQGKSPSERQLTEWRAAWQRVSDAPNASDLEKITAELTAIGLPEEDIEIEREMIDGLASVFHLQQTVAASGLPVLPSGHRVLGAEPCHFSASCSMPDEPAEPSGRLMFTGVRAIFVGGSAAVTIPWHAVSNVLQQHRDLILVRRDREMLHRFRCNVFTDAMSAAFLARTLSSRRPSV
jgi:hypothetical protein